MRQYTWDKHLETWVKGSGILGGPKMFPLWLFCRSNTRNASEKPCWHIFLWYLISGLISAP
ncbi:putative 1-phosphatidylinositol-3-phosphate 5-kinase FAB1C [Platanthera zijinensis]|uniref:1-phosphatidylinositol-3-phosphate 5-kinase FAB1C n=1 Tax=Platanthera zijinensis TaxID=2320716 RepID=A0AAP0AT21_9ASPA